MAMFDLATYQEQIREAAAAIRAKYSKTPKVGVICGTGMGGLCASVQNATTIPYDEIPNFPISTVESHHGNLVMGELSGRQVMMMQGRFHYYEGYTMREITFPVRVMKELGCEALIVMNAVGSVNALIPRGSLVLVDDHINMMGDNPLIGPNDEAMGPRFPDMSCPYDQRLRAIARQVALRSQLPLREGKMVAVAGPNMETRAEYRMFQIIGVDIVSMSTVPEILVANHCGLPAIAISTVTDECYPESLRAVELSEIIAIAKQAEPQLEMLVTGIIGEI